MKIEDLQLSLKKHKLDFYIVTRNNQFLGQDVLEEENKILELTNFSGSAGNLLVTPNKAYLFVDGRYELQAAQEVNSHTISISGQGDILLKWLKDNTDKNQKYTLGFNPWCMSLEDVKNMTSAVSHIKFIEDKNNLTQTLLSSKTANVFDHPIEFSGISREEKTSLITSFLNQNNLDAVFINAADSVSWLLNLRSVCLPDTPIIRAMAIVDKNANVSILGDNLDLSALSEDINIIPLNQLEKILSQYKKQTFGIDNLRTPHKILSLLNEYKIEVKCSIDPCQIFKAVKNPIELQGIANAHHRDGIALCKFFHWLDKQWFGKTELDIVDKLHSFRQSGEYFFSNSFETIAGFGSNGAIVHYIPKENTDLELKPSSLLLLDSGAQYLDGTTDVTRTIAIGLPTSEMIDNFSTVLKAHIALALSIFPKGTTGQSLDILSRSHLWQLGKDYNHGTGHGVGCFLNVHEGPLGISSRGTKYILEAGMITSIEPGYYQAGDYGIRIENLVEIVQSEYKNMLKFSTLTLAPIDKRLINKYLLNTREIEWLNNYHQNVYDKIENYLETDEKTWLKNACSPL